MQADEEYQNERLDHLGIVAGVCREIGLVEWIDRQAGPRRNLVSMGTALKRSIVSSFLGLCQEAKPSDRSQFHHGSLFAHLSPGRCSSLVLSLLPIQCLAHGAVVPKLLQAVWPGA